MQSLELFILESQSARRRLLQVFELPDALQTSPETQRNWLRLRRDALAFYLVGCSENRLITGSVVEVDGGVQRNRWLTREVIRKWLFARQRQVSITRSRNAGLIRFAGEVEFDRWAPMSSCAAKPEPAMKVPLQAGRSACALRKQDGES